MSCDGDEDDNAVDDDDDALDEDDYNYSDDDGYFYGEDDDHDDYASMQAQFDNVDLPPGVEASVSWMPKGVSNSDAPASAVPAHLKCTDDTNASSSSSLCVESSSGVKEKVVEAYEVVAKRYEGFKNFDVVEDPSDHHYANSGFQGRQVTLRHCISTMLERLLIFLSFASW